MANVSLLDLGSDISLRRRWFEAESFAHPAKLHLGLAQWIFDRYTRPGDAIADAMGGIGSTLIGALQQRHIILREVEDHWVALAHKNAARIRAASGLFGGQMDIAWGDAREPWGFCCDHVVMSPPYGIELPYHGEDVQRYLARRAARRAERRHSARWALLIDHARPQGGGFELFNYGTSPAQVGRYTGARYWTTMEHIYAQAHASIHPDGLMILVLKDHIRDGVRVRTADQTVRLCERLGFVLHARHQRLVSPLSLWQRRRAEAGLPIVAEEDVLVLKRK